jgi:phytoene dehydrogenase-like protein
VPPAGGLLQWGFVATGIDPSQALHGMDTLYLASPTMPLHPVDGWTLRPVPLRPALCLGGYTTPIAGLYLSGAGTHPGGGISGLPGRLAAHQILRAQTKHRRPWTTR